MDVFNHSFWKLYIKIINDLDPGLNLPESFKDFLLDVYDDTNLLHLVSGSERLSFSQELTPTLTLGLSLGLGLGLA